MEIKSIVKRANLQDFRPLLYIINYRRVADIIKQISVEERAHPLSIEYLIEDLPRKYFEILIIDKQG